MSLPVLIVGGGGHAKVLIEVLRLLSKKILGIFELDPTRINQDVLGIHVIGTDEMISGYAPTSLQLVNAVGSVQITKVRKNVFDKFKESGYTFATVIHPSAVVASDVILGEGAQIMAGVVIQPGSTIGMNAIVNTKTSVDHDCFIGDHVHLSPGVTLSGSVRVLDGSHIGTGATIIQGITIGRNSLIGAGSVVVNDVPANAEFVGVPARKK
jgi:UDP-perosamine 4-acetyltransferase